MEKKGSEIGGVGPGEERPEGQPLTLAEVTSTFVNGTGSPMDSLLRVKDALVKAFESVPATPNIEAYRRVPVEIEFFDLLMTLCMAFAAEVEDEEEEESGERGG